VKLETFDVYRVVLAGYQVKEANFSVLIHKPIKNAYCVFNL